MTELEQQALDADIVIERWRKRLAEANTTGIIWKSTPEAFVTHLESWLGKNQPAFETAEGHCVAGPVTLERRPAYWGYDVVRVAGAVFAPVADELQDHVRHAGEIETVMLFGIIGNPDDTIAIVPDLRETRAEACFDRLCAELRRWAIAPTEALRAQAPGDPALQAEGIALLREMQPTLAEVATGVREMRPTLDEAAAGMRDLQAGQKRILARFDQQEQRILAPILAQLDAQQAEQTAAVLDALNARIFPADELGRHLAVIQMALAELNIRATQMGDRQLAESARQVTEFASAPGLDIKHKLKVTIPIVPVLLSYEGAFELGSRLNLEEAWRALRGWITGG